MLNTFRRKTVGSYKDRLINKPEAFLRETFEARMHEYGFKNMERMEKFLWDLELFLQIQENFKERIVLKGGAATQFYLPIEAQRTSIDIDMIFNGSKEEIDYVLETIVSQFNENGGVFSWKEYKPRNPKTSFPLYTYYVEVPSVLTPKELRSDEKHNSTQEVKVEFIMQRGPIEYKLVNGSNIFAVNSESEYQILSLNHLFADKLTTLGPNTIGVQNDRLDEQIKQFYDIWMLSHLHFIELDINEVRNKYLERAQQECESRNIKFDIDEIRADVRIQMLRYKRADSGNDLVLKKAINDFNSLYLNAKVDFNIQVVACGAALVELMYEIILDENDWNIVDTAIEIERLLQFDGLEGKERGAKIKAIKQTIQERFGSYSCIDVKELKGKRPVRIFWAIVNKDNIDEIRKSIEEA
ncbi:nucleotidyl transferase AbiEii/AbiGii toxin family protein [Lachnospiraceae bacterium MD1]|uniref:Nucleotidyl transferase AbiEii/AbiGii toxin family protein n=1 Tax=Variimorphobacter saccharofermentans TaxID=2755051 RepID=A0A839K426_9FIRM|nr:nucleotidyl transferase AbiEii/AbiGii toxin family protein [Variimorphobacter saccharofermentans]MBB2184653.1 nucleotidyl transferase AbiEii/AbiGii toxin family protein [Variimorphobacter saccharofermentans]